MISFTQDDHIELDVIKKAFGLDIIVFLDWETFYKSKANNGSKSYSLKSLTYPNYIFGERFQEVGLGMVVDLGDEIAYGHGKAFFHAQMQLIADARAEGKRVAVVAHNTVFDGAICHWLHGIKFDFYFDTMLMRKYLAAHKRAGLAACAKDEWPDDPALRKGTDLADVDGIKYEYIAPRQHESLAKYCRQDVNLMRRLFLAYIPRIGLSNSTELRAMHITLRGAIEPQFDIKDELLHEVVTEEVEKDGVTVVAAIQQCLDAGVEGVTPKTFSSNPQYETLLRNFKLTVPKKISKVTGTLTPALGKADPEYIRLQIDNPEFSPLYKARARMKSPIARTRAQSMLSVSTAFRERGFNDVCMPFFLNYYGAGQTGRWSGGQKLNQQNNPRGGKHRLSMRAPRGYKIGVCDLANIELRVNLWFCGQENLLANYRVDEFYDLYSAIATDVFGYEVTKKTHPDERQTGKAAALGLGFAMGWFGFQQYLAGGPMGMEPMFKDDTFCRGVKNTYDIKHYAIKAMWHFLANHVTPVIVSGGEIRFGPNDSYLATKDRIVLPSGRVLQYSNARYKGEETRGGIITKVVFDSDKVDRWQQPTPKFLWHGLLLENIAQATARDIIAEQLVAVDRELMTEELGWVMGSVHDELLAALKEGSEEKAYEVMTRTMSIAPDWAAGLPLANEGGYAKEYSK